MTFLQSVVVEDQPSLTTTAAIVLLTREVSLVQHLHVLLYGATVRHSKRN